jgi:hypothetical protein
MRAVLGSEWKASRARASTGSPSLAKLLNNPDTSSDTEVRDRENPHEEFIAYVSPTAIAAPPSTVLETAVVVSVATVACRKVWPGIVATTTNW